MQVEASVYFNRVAAGGCESIDNGFGIRVAAYDGEPANFPVRIGTDALDFAQTPVPADDDQSTWQPGTVQLTLPSGTTYVAVWIFINEGGFNDVAYPEFHGHYADNASLSVGLLL